MTKDEISARFRRVVDRAKAVPRETAVGVLLAHDRLSSTSRWSYEGRYRFDDPLGHRDLAAYGAAGGKRSRGKWKRKP